MERVSQIAKCIAINRLNNNTLEFKFDKELNLKTPYIELRNLEIVFRLKKSEDKYLMYFHRFIEKRVKKWAESIFLNKYCLIQACYIEGSVVYISYPIDKESLWQDLGNLENPPEELINFYIKVLNDQVYSS